MPNRDPAALPSSHVFVTLAHRRSQKTLVIPRWLAGAAFGLLLAAGLWLVGCTLYVAGHDTLLAGLLRRERDAQLANEDRITALRRELDRATSQRVLLDRTVASRLDALASREADLRRHADLIATLTRDIRPGALRPSLAKAVEPTPAQAADTPDPAGAAALPLRLTHLEDAFQTLATAQTDSLGALRTAADGKVARYRAAFDTAGLSPARFARPGQASGGPFVPLAKPDAFESATLSLRTTVAEAERLQQAAERVPFGKPLEGSPEVTSPFGARLDPFLGRPALHTGVDLRDEAGTAVLATAPGRVSFAGAASGYGDMVEIDHGNGLSTRYAHLSAIAVSLGEHVARDAMVGRVGATGRATGPHLHYETRIDGEPVDPMRFLAAGQRLAAADRRP